MPLTLTSTEAFQPPITEREFVWERREVFSISIATRAKVSSYSGLSVCMT